MGKFDEGYTPYTRKGWINYNTYNPTPEERYAKARKDQKYIDKYTDSMYGAPHAEEKANRRRRDQIQQDWINARR